MFLMNHSVHQNGTFNPAEFINTYHRCPVTGFTAMTTEVHGYHREVGIQSSAIGYGLGS